MRNDDVRDADFDDMERRPAGGGGLAGMVAGIIALGACLLAAAGLVALISWATTCSSRNSGHGINWRHTAASHRGAAVPIKHAASSGEGGAEVTPAGPERGSTATC